MNNNENSKKNDIQNQTEKKSSEIAKTWISGARSVTMIIERNIAEEYGLTEPSHVVLERTERGILIRRLDVGGLDG